MSLPTFIIAGAQKCGTTTLHQLLRQHPQLLMSTPKEVHFFDLNWDEGLDWYAAHFPMKTKHVHAGESSPTYMYDPESRDRMIKTLPHAQMIVILRDPTERAYSHYWHSRRKGTEKVETFEEALERERKRVRSKNVRVRSRYSYLARGVYIDQIEALEAAYGRDRLHVMLLEDLVEHQERSLTELFDFLGVSAKPAGRIEPRRANAWVPGKIAVAAGSGGPAGNGPVASGAAADGIASAVATISSAGADADADEDSDADEDDDAPAATSSSYPPINPQTRDRLADYFRPHNDRLGAWLGRDLSHWGQPRRRRA